MCGCVREGGEGVRGGVMRVLGKVCGVGVEGGSEGGSVPAPEGRVKLDIYGVCGEAGGVKEPQAERCDRGV